MHIADHIVTHEFTDTLYTLTDDRRTKMTDMQRFRNIGSTIVHDDRLRILGLVAAESSLIFLHGSNHRSKIILT